MKPYVCKKHGAVEPYVTPRPCKAGFTLRQCRLCRQARQNARNATPEMKAWYAAYRVRNIRHEKERARLYQRNIRLAVLASFGNKCECCGIWNEEFLTVDHVNGGGGLARRTTQKGAKCYRDLYLGRVNRSDYRLLCYNCNLSLGKRGYCPHIALLHLVEGAS